MSETHFEQTGTGDKTPHQLLLDKVQALLIQFEGLDESVKDLDEEKAAASRVEFGEAVKIFEAELEAKKGGMGEEDLKLVNKVLDTIKGIEHKPVEEVKEDLEKVTSLFGRLSNWCQENLLTPFVNFCKAVVDIVCKYTRKAGEYMGFFKKEEGQQEKSGQDQQEEENLDGTFKNVPGETPSNG
ncbi:MAG: hypothetical protein P1U61_01755 [Legionellaceae bacterium]|nr:hypothetical protein [Legionellaceae bacterium]